MPREERYPNRIGAVLAELDLGGERVAVHLPDAVAVHVATRCKAPGGPQNGPDDLWMISSTSGTAGRPRCMMRSRDRLWAFDQVGLDVGELGRGDVIFTAVPASDGFGQRIPHFAPAHLGVPTVVMGRFGATPALGADRERARHRPRRARPLLAAAGFRRRRKGRAAQPRRGRQLCCLGQAGAWVG